MPRISARLCIFVKPFDEEVFRSLFVFVRFIQDLEKELNINIELTCHEGLNQAFADSHELLREFGIRKHMLSYRDLTEGCRELINYIVTFGGDGTILYAAKQFNRAHVPPMITFAQGSLGFMANFTFDDHPLVFRQLFTKDQAGQHKPSETIGYEHRLRLKINMGPGCNPIRHVFRGD